MKRLLSPKTDIVFKMLFEEDTEALADLIDSVLARPENRRVRSVRVKNPGILPEDISKKYIVLDIRAEDESGEQFDVEMQVRKYESYSKRSLFYLCKLYVEQLDSGTGYGELKPVAGIHFLDYEEFPDCPDYHFRFAFHDLRHPELLLNEDLVLHIVELPAFERLVRDAAVGSLEEWVRFLNRADSETEETMREHYQNPKIRKTYYSLKSLSEDETARRRAEMREAALRNEISELHAATLKGKIEETIDSISQILEIRFHVAAESVVKRLAGISDLDRLRAIRKKALTANSLDEFERYLSSL